MENVSLLGLDFGTKNVGIAISHGFMAEAMKPLDFSDKDRFFAQLQKIITEQKITKIIIGLPLKEGQETSQSGWNREQAEQVKIKTGLPVEFVDESYSSVEADRFLGDRDSESARIILEQYLESRDV